MVDLGFQDPHPKPPEMPLEQGKRHNTTIGLATWIGLNLAKNCYKTGERHAKMTNDTYFARPQLAPVHG